MKNVKKYIKKNLETCFHQEIKKVTKVLFTSMVKRFAVTSRLIVMQYLDD